MENLRETIEQDGLTLKIYYDECPECPREWSNIGTLVMAPRCGIKTELKFDFDTPEEDVERLKEQHGALLVLPVYKYEHSGVIYRTYPFSCPWDSGQVGYIIATAESINEICGAQWWDNENEGKTANEGLTEAGRKWLTEALDGEIEVLSQWANGDVYGYTIDDGENQIDSCWGYYGEYGIKCIKSEFDSRVADKIEEEFPLFLACGVEIPEAL